MPKLGYESIGALWDDVVTNSKYCFGPFIVPGDAKKLLSYSIYGSNPSDATISLQGGLYRDVAGQPGSPVPSSQSDLIPIANASPTQWWELTIAELDISTLALQPIWIAFAVLGPGLKAFRRYYNSPGAHTSYYEANGDLTIPWVPVNPDSEDISLYFTYSTGGILLRTHPEPLGVRYFRND